MRKMKKKIDKTCGCRKSSVYREIYNCKYLFLKRRPQSNSLIFHLRKLEKKRSSNAKQAERRK